MSKVINAPKENYDEGYSIFLAGECRTNWRDEIQDRLKNLDVIIYNPDRPDWDSSWKESKDDSQFRNQVEWELNALEKSNLIVMRLSSISQSPISLIEFGLFSRTGKLVVYCEDEFWKKGSIDMYSEWFGIRQVDSLEEVWEIIEREMGLEKI